MRKFWLNSSLGVPNFSAILVSLWVKKKFKSSAKLLLLLWTKNRTKNVDIKRITYRFD